MSFGFVLGLPMMLLFFCYCFVRLLLFLNYGGKNKLKFLNSISFLKAVFLIMRCKKRFCREGVCPPRHKRTNKTKTNQNKKKSYLLTTPAGLEPAREIPLDF